MSSDRQVLNVMKKLSDAASGIARGFIWKHSPEGYEYWKAQSLHLERLVDQISQNMEAYRR